MNRRPYLENIALCLVTFLFALVLTGCASGPDLSMPPDPEAELAACRAVMEEIQHHGSYHIFSHTDYQSDLIQNSFSDTHTWKSGDDWFWTSRPTDMSMFAGLCRDEEYFNNFDDIGGAWEDAVEWTPCEPSEEELPWLCRFCWDAQEISLASTAVSGHSRIISILVHDTWDRGTYQYNIAENYTVDFYFDENSSFEKAVLNLSFADDGTETETETMTVISTDGEEIAARIAKEYQRAMEQNQMTNP